MKDKSSKQIALGAVINYIAIAINILLGFVYTPWMIRTIGTSNYGLYTLAISVINIFAIDFGLSAATSRFVAKKVAEGDDQGVKDILGLVFKLYIIISAICSVSLIVVYPFLGRIYQGLTVEELGAFGIIYIIVATYSVLSFPYITLNGIFTAYEEFVAMKLCDLVQKIGSVVLIIVILLCGGDIFSLVLVNAISGLLTIAVKIIILRKKRSLGINWKYKNSGLLREILFFSVWSTIVSISVRLIFNLVPTILGIFSNSTAIAEYGVAGTIDGYFYAFSAALSGLFLPKIMRLMYGNTEERGKIEALSIRIGRIQLLIIALLYISFFSIGQEFFNLWMGDDFKIAYYCVLLLSFPDLIEYAQQIPQNAIIAADKVKAQAKAYIITTVVSIIVVSFGALLRGSLGVSMAIGIVCIFRTVTMCYVYVKELNFDIKLFSRKTYPRMLPVLVICAGVAIEMNQFWKANSWLMLCCKGICVVILYSILTYAFFLEKSEKTLLKNALARFIK